VYQALNGLFQEAQQIDQEISALQRRLIQPFDVEAPLSTIQPVEELILSYLGKEQYSHWQKLKSMIEITLSEKQGMYPRPFHPQQLQILGMNQTEITQLLQLLEYLGMVIQVTGRSSEDDGEPPRKAYRRVAKHDLFSSVKHPWE
jgi:hypothetical protein